MERPRFGKHVVLIEPSDATCVELGLKDRQVRVDLVEALLERLVLSTKPLLEDLTGEVQLIKLIDLPLEIVAFLGLAIDQRFELSRFAI